MPSTLTWKISAAMPAAWAACRTRTSVGWGGGGLGCGRVACRNAELTAVVVPTVQMPR
jgi:hypothetical protein